MALRYNSPDKRIKKIQELWEDYDVKLKNGPNSFKIPLKMSIQTSIPVIERLNWFGLPMNLDNRKEWLDFLGEKELLGMFFDHRIKPTINYKIKKMEISSIHSGKVYVPSKVNCDEIKN
jgi:hypothetical protein